jgi:hypothetical protein
MEEIELSKLFIFTGCLAVFVTMLFLAISFITDCPKTMRRLFERIFRPALSKERKFIIRMENKGDGFYYYQELELGYMWHKKKNHGTRYNEAEVKSIYDYLIRTKKYNNLTILELEKP